MKRTIPIFVFMFGAMGCDLGERASVPPVPLTAVFQMTDTSGREVTSFRSAEDFDLRFAVTNTTGKQITYHMGDSGPVASFRIVQGDSVVATSLDGYVFLMVVSTGHLPPDQSLQVSWRGPNTPARDPRIVLAPGSYMARVSFTGFDEVKVNQMAPIAFSIVP